MPGRDQDQPRRRAGTQQVRPRDRLCALRLLHGELGLGSGDAQGGLAFLLLRHVPVRLCYFNGK